MAKIKVRLSEPIVLEGGTKISVLEVRDRVTLGDLLTVEKAGGGELEQDVHMYALLTGLLPTDLHSLSVEDYEALGEVVREAKKARQAAKNPQPNATPQPKP